MIGIRSVAVAVLMSSATLVAAGGLAPALAQEATARMIGAVRSQGVFFEIGEQRALFMGALQGTLYVESGSDGLDGAAILCPASFAIEGASAAYSAEGHCAIARAEEHKIYARWTCAGTVLQGCRGRLTLTGGTGRFAKVSGESDLIMRGTLMEPADSPRVGPRSPIGISREVGTGLLLLPSLRYRVP